MTHRWMHDFLYMISYSFITAAVLLAALWS